MENLLEQLQDTFFDQYRPTFLLNIKPEDAHLIRNQQFNMQDFVPRFRTRTTLEWQEMTPGIYYLYSGIEQQHIWKMVAAIFQDRPFLLSHIVYYAPGFLDAHQ